MPKPAPQRWPYLEHRNMEQVMRREAASKKAHEAKRQKMLLRKQEVC